MRAKHKDNKTTKAALKAVVPVVLGYFPTGFAFGLMLTSAGYQFWLAGIMSVAIYAGAGQYLAVEAFMHNEGLLQIAIITALVNSKHLFYGLSLLGDYQAAGRKKPYLIFSLTDEVYALLTKPGGEKDIDRTRFCFCVSVVSHSAWILSSLLGAVTGSLLHFNAEGLQFAMTALFIVILIEQFGSFKTRIPFIVGACSALAALVAVGRNNMLLGGALFSVVSLILLRKKVESHDAA